MLMGEIKQLNIKNQTCYFYSDLIDLKEFDAKTMIFTTLDTLQLRKF